MIFLSFSSVAQSDISLTEEKNVKKEVNYPYQLFPTQNNWTFIKLDTRNGRMWQVHFSINNDDAKGEVVLNGLSLVFDDKEENGRFTLYPTNNFYNFILLDQLMGFAYQVQWSMDKEKRFVIPLF